MAKKKKKSKKKFISFLISLAVFLYFNLFSFENKNNSINLISLNCEDNYQEGFVPDITLKEQSNVLLFDLVFNKPRWKKVSHLKMSLDKDNITVNPSYSICLGCKEAKCVATAQINGLPAGNYDLLANN